MDEKEQTDGIEQEVQPEGKVETQPTVEELQGRIKELASEVERKEGVIQTTKKELKEVIRRGGSKAEVDALSKKLDGMEGNFELLVDAMDDLAHRISGEEEPRPQRQTYKERFNARKAQPAPEVNPAEKEALEDINEILDERGWDIEGKEVAEYTAGAKTPREALKMLRTKVKELDKENIKKEAEKEVSTMRQAIKEEIIKEMGLAAPGAGSPSGSLMGFDKTEQDYADGKISREEYKKARKEQGL